MISITRTTQRNVKNWKDSAMARRWTAAGMLVAETQFRRIKGHRDLMACAGSVWQARFR
jgi:putative transposase